MGDGILDERRHVIVGDAVDDALAFAPTADHPGFGRPIMFLGERCRKLVTADIARSIENDAARPGFRVQGILVECSGLWQSGAARGEALHRLRGKANVL